ncbi:MAG: 4-(cytidine 5'-diphospho)-2-C-methyl-D-erythritol kinase [Phycisphaerales bacterium]
MPGPHACIELRAPAKLNLSLAVGAPVPPKGYHPIASWFVPIDLGDELTLGALPEGAASVHDIAWHDGRAIDWPIEKDLAVRAHRAVERHVGRTLPLRLTLRKRIPTGGGLGGGSSDAAATLIGVDRLFDLRLPHAQMLALAGRLGSDVAFFLDERREGRPRPAMVMGFGEVIERTASVAADVVLILPPMGCPTAEVYRAFDDAADGRESAHAGVPREADVRAAIEEAVRTGRIDPTRLFNDLGAAAFAAVPEFAELVTRRIHPALAGLAERHGPLIAHMTGSGSTLFVIAPKEFGGASTAAELSEDIARAVPEVRTMCVGVL